MRVRHAWIVAMLAALAFSTGGASAAERALALPGHVPKQIRTAAKLGRLPSNENVELSLAVRVDQNLLDQTLAQLYGPKAPAHKRFLSPDEFAKKFNLAEKRQKLKDFAQAAGLTVNAAEERPNSLIVKAAGPAGLVEKAFGVELNRYRGADGQIFRAHETEPRIPAALSPHLNAVLGLSNVHGVVRPHSRRFRPVHTRPVATAGTAIGSAAGLSPALIGNGPGGFLAPADIKTIYGLSGTLTGSGQTVALFELAGYTPGDITTYESHFGISPITVTPVLVDGAVNTCVDANGCDEVTLDIELVAALAPGLSSILVYEGPNTNQGLIDTYARIANDDSAQAVSTSWGEDEQDAGTAVRNSESLIFQQMASQGQTIYAAAGDCGAFDQADSNGNCITGNGYRVDDPASQPYVTGVGGTSLSGTIASHTEAVWNELSAGGGAGGGGISSCWPLPSYQSGVAGTSSQSFRNVPDVALNADPDASPYGIYYSGKGSGSWFGYGGTSCAAPLWAALTTLINQQRSTNGDAPLGFANPTLYHLATSASYGSYFNDITSGGNGLYQAGTGYDNATGWGSFKGDALVNAISAVTPGAVSNIQPAVLGISSITWSWSAATNATSYVLTNGSGSQVLAASVNATQWTETGLSANALSQIQVAGVHQGLEGAFLASPSTYTYAAAPGAPALAQASISSMTASWTACAAGDCSGYALEAATSPLFSGTVSSSMTLRSAQNQLAVTGLAANTSYYMKLAALNALGAATWGSVAGPYATLAAPPAAAAPGDFIKVSSYSMTVAWSADGNPLGHTTYTVVLTSGPYPNSFAGNVSFSTCPAGAVPTATSTGPLVADTLYSLYVRAKNFAGVYTAYSLLGSTCTLSAPPSLPGQPFSARTTDGFSFAFNGNNPAGTQYLVQISPRHDFSLVAASLQTAASPVAVSGLLSNEYYYAEVASINQAGSPGSFAATNVGTATLVAAPQAALVPMPATGETTGYLTLDWSPGTLASGTTYLAQISSSPAFAFVSASSKTANAWALFASGVLPNTTYYGQAQALGNWGQPSSAWLSPAGVGASLAMPPGGAAFAAVYCSSMTVSWTPAPPSPSSMTCEGYRLDVSAAPDFSSGVISSATAAGAASATVTGLSCGTLYYARLGSLNWQGAATEVPVGAGSTTTDPAPVTTGTVTGSGLTLTTANPFPMVPQFGSAQLVIPPSALAPGTTVSFSGDPGSSSWPNPSEAQSGEGTILALAQHAVMEIYAGATPAQTLQPASPVTLTLAYDPQLAAGHPESSLHLFGYAPASGQWTLIPSQADASAHTLTAWLPHFSYYAPFFIVASTGASLSALKVYPQPWEIGGSGLYSAAYLQFSNLPAGAWVRIFTVTGELVNEGTAGDGTFRWDGTNRFGRKAASGTYLAVFEAGGQRQTRRVVIIR